MLDLEYFSEESEAFLALASRIERNGFQEDEYCLLTILDEFLSGFDLLQALSDMKTERRFSRDPPYTQ